MDSQERLELKALVQEAMAPVEKRLDGIEIRLDSIETRLADLPTRAEVQTIVDDAYDKQAASALREFGAIQRQLASLESRVGKLETHGSLIFWTKSQIEKSAILPRKQGFCEHAA